MTPPVTIIMRSKNSSWVIGQALTALFSQTYTQFALHIVDSGSSDDTIDIVKQFPCQLKRIPPKRYFPGPVLNEAIEESKSPLIVFLNSDAVLLSPRSLEHLIQAFDDPDTQAAFGRQVPRPDAEPWVLREFAHCFPASGSPPECITLALPIAAIRRSAWQDHPFYAKAWGSEDTEWGLWARKAGLKIEYVPTATAMHSHNYSYRELYGRKFIEGEADAFIYEAEYGLPRFLANTLKQTLRESRLYLANPLGLANTPIRAFIDNWAYYRGHKWGACRLATDNRDQSVGQATVLK